jgi:hypothetical protein
VHPVAETAPGRHLAGILDHPVVGMTPGIVFSVLVGPGRYELSVALALALAVFIVVAGRVLQPGGTLKILEVADIVFFALLAVLGVISSPGTHRWLETYAGEISNIALVIIAFGSMAIRVPFTIQYAREQIAREYWDSPAFLRTNYVITGVWGLAFLVAAIAGGFGDLVLHSPNNIWTGWIIQIAAIVGALRFTKWYPETVRARVRTGRPASTPHVRSLLTPLAGLLVPVGIVVLIFNGGPVWLGIALIAVGVVTVRALHASAK